MKKFCLLAVVGAVLTLLIGSASGHEPVVRVRTPIDLPAIPGFITLKCDFHTHTVFSDGYVWPTVRVEEAWRNGLDVIAITEHLEYQPHKRDVTTNHNRSFEIAADAGKDLNVLVVKGSEVTRSMPPGHLNAIFLKDSEPLAVKDWRQALAAAHEQGAFIFWNHPGPGIQSDSGERTWYPEHAELLKKGMLQGIEVVNGGLYFPEAHRWAIKHKLTMLSNFDAHNPTFMDLPVGGSLRPITLVFVQERSTQGLKEALLARRTAVLFEGKLVGEEQYLRPMFDAAAKVLNPEEKLRPGRRNYVQIQNTAGIDIELELTRAPENVHVQKEVTLPAGKVVLLQVTPKEGAKLESSKVALSYRATNFLVGPDEAMEVKLELHPGD